MISARKAALLEQRKRYGAAAKRKVLTPNSLSSSSQSIARRTADAELDSKIELYNDGQISNEEFLSYLKASSTNDLFTPAEKVDIQDKIRDFTKRVMVEGLQANYQNTAPGTYSRVQAAKSLASYFQTEANNMESGTPAQSKSLQEYGTWTERASSEEKAILKNSRKAQRASLFYEAAQFEPDTVEALEAKAKAYDRLSEQAEADEEMTEAMNYQTYAQNVRNKIPALIERQQKAEEREWIGTIKDQLKKIQDEYHDGKISLETAAQMAYQVNQDAIEAGDISTQMAVNTFSDKLQRDLEKGVQYGDIEGLVTFKRGTTGAGATISEMRKVFTREDDDYRTAKRQIDLLPDVLARYNALVQLQAAYIYGIKPNDAFPDGFEGLVQRKDFWDQLAEQYPNKNYENNSRDVQEKLDKLEYDVSQNTATLENITPGGVTEDMAKQIFGDILTQPPDTFGTRPTGAKDQGIMVGYDKYGQRYEKVVFLDTEYADPETGEIIKTKLGRDIAKVQDIDGTEKYVKLTPVNISDPTGAYPNFYQAEWNGEFIVSDPYTGEVKKARETVEENPMVSQWYESVKHLEKPVVPPTEGVPEEVTKPAEGLISSIPESQIVKPRKYEPLKEIPAQIKQTLRPVLKPVEEFIKTPQEFKLPEIQPTYEALKSFQLQPTIEAFKESAKPLIQPIAKAIEPTVSALKSFQLQPNIEAFKENAKLLYEKGKEKVKSLFSKLKFW